VGDTMVLAPALQGDPECTLTLSRAAKSRQQQ